VAWATDVIEIEPGLRIEFPGQSEDFRLGVEVGIIAGELATAPICLIRPLSMANLDQVRELARKFGYRVKVDSQTAGVARISIMPIHQKPSLQIVR
jgi:hypothetical protein